MWENTDQNISKYGHFSGSVCYITFILFYFYKHSDYKIFEDIYLNMFQ